MSCGKAVTYKKCSRRSETRRLWGLYYGNYGPDIAGRGWQKANKFFLSAFAVILATAFCYGEIYTPEQSNRVKINLGETAWKFIKSNPPNGAYPVNFDDASYPNVRIPHT